MGNTALAVRWAHMVRAPFFDQQQEIWHDVSARRVEFRELDRTPHSDHPAAPSDTR